MTKTYQVVGIGNAIVDVISQADDSFLDLMGIDKGIMQLVERERGEMLYGAMENRVQTPGGSVANTLAGLGMLGLKTGFIGRVHDDALGRFYAAEMVADGTAFVNAPVPGGELPTSRSMIFVSPDGERSMNTYLGISSEISEADVTEAAAGDTDIMFLEGYLYDKPKGKHAFDQAAKLTKAAGGKVGISLSDPFCVDRHRADFRTFVKEMDFVIGNEHEWESLYQADLSTALELAAFECGLVVCSRGGSDVVLVRGDEEAVVPVKRVQPVDTTGAGDQFAAGFLYGYATGQSLATCGRMGCVAAAEVISHIGPRPEADLKVLFQKEGLI
ncbi:Sugar or nucleoside kinase, ribokinase family [Celeribacter baekdonensis]|uniref:Sugar or nucleoside kinase, ribokinase family n=1 Tax=Celeribacter baekdonensis TaxID=875171 RepID=A0A1G7K3U0_9RHOB|nr:adenosine kinase [Celeribacter baekdonensis]MBU0641916.1 adenosine kinase [Alphaproteobacteria bacterium]MBU1280558.1 adenosine kinase [Alphaproteobacteria bacterium]MBU1572162.1 adenosine kinase [Alphaproteobacteria bacterium]MBU2078023.1 adenosine kinase [Alphaproteobacteria bacterium]MBU2159348.1 adenosine kinase [Alphaproteobacteria bacterium]